MGKIDLAVGTSVYQSINVIKYESSTWTVFERNFNLKLIYVNVTKQTPSIPKFVFTANMDIHISHLELVCKRNLWSLYIVFIA